ncbi:unnamed protein product, partial [Notodromas monacha]
MSPDEPHVCRLLVMVLVLMLVLLLTRHVSDAGYAVLDEHQQATGPGSASFRHRGVVDGGGGGGGAAAGQRLRLDVDQHPPAGSSSRHNDDDDSSADDGGDGGGGEISRGLATIFCSRPAPFHGGPSRCVAAHALRVYFDCSGGWGQEKQDELTLVDPMTGIREVESSLEVTRAAVDQFYGGEFACRCAAWSSQRGEVLSRKAVVTNA